MLERNNRNSHLMRRGATLALALFLLFAQSLAGSHFHQKDFRDNLTQNVQGGDAICSLCLFHFHAPVNAGAAPASAVPCLAAGRMSCADRAPLHAIAASQLWARGPPAYL